MALATTCPRCQTGFRVVPDQLKIRRGLVRCGQCRHVFSGLDSLRYVNETLPSLPVPAPSAGSPPAGSPPAASPPAGSPPATSLPAKAALAAASTAGGAASGGLPVRPRPAEPAPDDADQPATLLVPEADDDLFSAPRRPAPIREDFTLEGLDELDDLDALAGRPPDRQAPGEQPGALGQEVDDLDPDERLHATSSAADARAAGAEEPAAPPEDPSAAWSAAVLAPGPEEGRDPGAGRPAEAVDFFAPPSRAGGFASRGNAIAAVACGILGIALAVQVAFLGRDWFAARMPGVETALVAASDALGLAITPPRQLEALTLESFDVHAGASPQALVLNALLRNQAPHRVRWPSMELTLTDGAGAVVVRKVLSPGDYVPPAGIGVGVPAQQELPLQVALETAGIQPAGYNVKLFYP
jgi:predicted Zn finger-like uncharacterized protein